MVQGVVSGLFEYSGEDVPGGGPENQGSTDEVDGTGAAFSIALSSVPAAQFTPMPEQDLAIWTIGGLFGMLVRVAGEALRPAELRAIPVRRNDHD
jgi:hypothetical protein